MKNILKNQKDRYLTEYIAINKDGTPFWIEVNSSVLYNSKGEPDSILLVERDITQRKLIEEEVKNKNMSLRQAYENAKYLKEKADKANELKSKFLAIISHELITPLNAIIGTVELMNTKRDFSEKYMNVLVSSSELLNVIINDLTDLNKIEINNLALINRKFSFFEMIESVENIIRFRSTRKELNFIMDIGFDENIYLSGDVSRLKQVLLNLLINAVKYTEKGFIRLSIQKTYEEKSFVKIRFNVEDTGIGITKENMERIFLPYFQVDSSHSKKHYGSGIGLYLSQTLVKLMGGNIVVESVPGVGSKFYFEVEFEKYADSAIFEDENESLLTPIDVLIVENSETNLMILNEMCKKIGLNPDTAHDGKSSVEKAKDKHYDIIFMDIQMPEMDGFEATIKIKEFDKNVKIIAISANGYEEDFRKSIDCAMDDFCPKPITLRGIKDIIHKYAVTEKSHNLVDFQGLLDNFNDEQIAYNALKLFIKEMEENFKKLSVSLEESNFEVVRQTLHKIKGATLTIYAEKMSQVTIKFYNNFYSIPTENLYKYTMELESVFVETKNAIQNYIQSMGTKA